MSRQNVYDDPVFFAAYQEMRDAESGINAALDHPALRALLRDVGGMSVLDLGCSDGRLCRELASVGAARVVGVDPSARMLALASERTGNPAEVNYLGAFAEDVALDNGSFDLVVSSLALHDVADLGSLLLRIAGWLRPAGWLVATMEHPVRTADPERSLDPGIVDNYATEVRRDQSWFVDGVVKYHRRVSTILNAVIAAGFDLRAVQEPTPSPAAPAARPELDRHNRRSAILALAARKTGTHKATEGAALCGDGSSPAGLVELLRHAALRGDAGWVDVVNAVAAIPYGRAPGSTPADVLASGRGTCSTKHYLLAQALREGWPELSVTLWHRVYRLTPNQAASLFGPRASDVVPPEGLVDVHTYLQVDPGTGPLVVDATFPLDQPWDGTSSMPLRCTDGLDVAGGPSPTQTKQQLVGLHCDPRVREPFIAWLASC